jgi:hypothetical protein
MPEDNAVIPFPADNELPEYGEDTQCFEDCRGVEQRVRDELELLVEEAKGAAAEPQRVSWFGPRLLTRLIGLGKLLYLLYLTCAEERHSETVADEMYRGGRKYRKRGRQARSVGTLFGKVRYWRTYLFCDEAQKGFYPLDDALGMTRDGFTLPVVGWVSRLATKMSYEASGAMFAGFFGWAPATRTIEEMVLGLGSYAHRYQEQAAPPPGDGEVLVIQTDSKGVPTATLEELQKRRGKRAPNPHPHSKRHRGRNKRKRRGPKKRKRGDDKSKNAKMATLVVMYTLEKATDDNGNPKLLGPKNVRVFGSFGPKKVAFDTARREAIKRGFGPGSGKLIQFVNDGDEDLETYRREYFGDYPEEDILPTADLPHVLEYLWSAAASLFPDEGTGQRAAWVAKQKKRLLQSRAELVREELAEALERVPKKGPGNKAKRERLEDALRYLTNNANRLDYKRVAHLDLELASGMVEGIVKNVLGLRFDHGGMRWIVRRAEALLQLRCIEVSGQWEPFLEWLDTELDKTTHCRSQIKLRRNAPSMLPSPRPPLPVGYAHAPAKAA